MRLFLFIIFAVSAAAQSVGDFSISYKATSSGPQPIKSWAKANSTLWGTDSSGNPQSITIGSGLSLASGVLTASGGGVGTGTVTSVGLSLPGIFSVTGSPITSSGTLAASLATQSANRVWAGPATGTAAAPTFRALVADDLPDLSSVYQPFSTTLTTYSGIAPSANVQTLLGAANYAAFKTSLSLGNVENTALSTWAGSTNITTVNATQNISNLSNLTGNGFVKTSGGDGTLSVDTTTYQPKTNNLDELSFFGSSLGGHGASDANKVAKYGNAGELGASLSILIYGDAALNVTTITAQAGVNPTVLLPSTGGTLALTSDNITGTAAGLSATLAVASGGTGQTTLQAALNSFMAASGALSQGDVFYFNGTNVVRLAAGTSGYFLKTNGAGANPSWAAGGGGSGGKVAQVVYTEDATAKSATTTIPNDNTIPQNTEGTEYTEINTTITPTNASSRLAIHAVISDGISASGTLVFAIFKDSDADAKAVQWHTLGGSGFAGQITLYVSLTAGSTSAQTFKVRFGRANGSPTVYINQGGSAVFGGKLISSMTITEILP